ncbi:hypothetical protein BDZ91DRAFT_719210 [Kalaharituber pfeilii]|nr:hypothetical protein BDZ91DRAFT_719210 [Kalaharituber pfeilii]
MYSGFQYGYATPGYTPPYHQHPIQTSSTSSPMAPPPTRESWLVSQDRPPPGYLPPLGHLSPAVLFSATRQTSTRTEITQRTFTREEVLTPAEADWPCREMGQIFLFTSLVQLLGLSSNSATYYAAWIMADVRWFIEHNFDFGFAYASIRKAWRPLQLSYPIDLAEYRSRCCAEYDRMMVWRRDVLQREGITGHEVILEPYGIKPHRIWDLKSNRVVDYIMLFAHCSTYGITAGTHMLHPAEIHPTADGGPVPDIYPPFWAVTHSWTSDSDAVIYETSANGYQWPVRLPAGVTIEQVRRELLSFHGDGGDYVWLDVMCLRQEAGPQYAQIKAQEWKLDVPTIGNIYRLATYIVRYLNGLGRTFSTEGWDNERHWLRRAWTLQEIRPAEETHTGGVPPEIVNPMNAIGNINGREISLRKALAPVLELAQNAASPSGCTVYDLTREMGRRLATNETDKVAGLCYLLRTSRLPAYSATVTANEAWVRCFHELQFLPRLEVLFDFPYRGNTGTRWFPEWSELMQWPDRRPDLTHTPPRWSGPYPFYLPPSADADPSRLYVSHVTLVCNVWLEAAGNAGEYCAKFGGQSRALGFITPYVNQRPIPKGTYTLATLNVKAECNWVVCQPQGQIMLKTFWPPVHPGAAPTIAPTMALMLAKVGVLRTDAVSDLRSQSLMVGSPCLFV